ncbi:MAG: PEGA domain-containing protein, partial [Bacteroidetes bacterium]|nr:PEGA domain-containing protein [Bacteroidota bacterium]
MSNNSNDYPKYPIIADNYYDLFGFNPFDNFTESELEDAFQERFRYWRVIAIPELKTDKDTAMEELGKARKLLKNRLEKQEYDRMLKNKLLSRLDDVIESSVKIDQELDPKEEKHIIEKGKSFGFTEKEINDRINELLKKFNAERVSARRQAAPIQSPVTTKGLPILKIDDYKPFNFSDLKLGTTRSGSFTIRNFGGGSLEADIIYSAPWLSFNFKKIHQKDLPQTLTFTIDTSADKICRLGSSHNEAVILKYNKGGATETEKVEINFSMEGYELVIKRMRNASTGITATFSAFFLLYLLSIIHLSGWAIFGLIVSLFFCGWGLLIVKDDENGGWWFVAFGYLILFISNATIFFTCFPILLTWWISKPVFSRYPLKTYFAGVIPVSVFLLNWVGYSFLSGNIKIPSFPNKESSSRTVTISKQPSYKLGTVISDVGANVRSGPSTNYSSVGALKQGESVSVLSKENGWYKVQFVRYGRNKIGYIYSSLLRLNNEYGIPKSSEVKSITEKSTSLTKEIEQVPIVIESMPEGANVYIYGQEKGKTPLNINLNSGYNTVLLKYPGYKDYKERILINTSGKSNFNFKL